MNFYIRYLTCVTSSIFANIGRWNFDTNFESRCMASIGTNVWKTVQFSTENVRHIHWKLFDKWTKKVFDNKNFDRKCSTATLGVEHFPSLTLLFYNIFRHSTSGFIKYSMGFSIYWKKWLLNLHRHGLFSTFEHSD